MALSDTPIDACANIVLTGFMGTGKTTTGRMLARSLGFVFVDTDHVIEGRHGEIPTIFAEQGEDAFRRIEREVAAELAQQAGLVISTGGRLMLDEDNAARLSGTGVVFCLTASAETILERVLGGAADRPLLAVEDPRQRVLDLLEERREGYARFTQVDTDGRAPRAVATELADLAKAAGVAPRSSTGGGS